MKQNTHQETLSTNEEHRLFFLFIYFYFVFESTQLARQLHQERTQMEMQ